MAMFTVYLDASGDPDDPGTPSLAVAGFIATAEQWIRIERKWQAVLDRYQVSELHMKNLAHFKKEYAKWQDAPEIRTNFLRDLIDVLRPHVRNSFSCTVWLSDYEMADDHAQLRMRISPLAVAGMCCIEKVQKWAVRHRVPQSNIKYFLEDGDTDKGNLMLCAKTFLKVNLIPLPKNEINTFQTADLLAYEQHLAAKHILGKTRPIASFSDLRKSLQALSQIPCGGPTRSDWSFKSGTQFTEIMHRLKNDMLGV